MKVKKSGINNDVWIRNHFEMIVDKYGKYPYILVAGGKVYPVRAGENIQKIEKRIPSKLGKAIGMPVPQRQDFDSIL